MNGRKKSGVAMLLGAFVCLAALAVADFAQASGSRFVQRSRSVNVLGVPQQSFSQRVVVRQRGVVVHQPSVVQLRGVQTLSGSHCLQQGFFAPRVHDPGMLLFFGP